MEQVAGLKWDDIVRPATRISKAGNHIAKGDHKIPASQVKQHSDYCGMHTLHNRLVMGSATQEEIFQHISGIRPQEGRTSSRERDPIGLSRLPQPRQVTAGVGAAINRANHSESEGLVSHYANRYYPDTSLRKRTSPFSMTAHEQPVTRTSMAQREQVALLLRVTDDVLYPYPFYSVREFTDPKNDALERASWVKLWSLEREQMEQDYIAYRSNVELDADYPAPEQPAERIALGTVNVESLRDALRHVKKHAREAISTIKAIGMMSDSFNRYQIAKFHVMGDSLFVEPHDMMPVDYDAGQCKPVQFHAVRKKRSLTFSMGLQWLTNTADYKSILDDLNGDVERVELTLLPDSMKLEMAWSGYTVRVPLLIYNPE